MPEACPYKSFSRVTGWGKIILTVMYLTTFANQMTNFNELKIGQERSRWAHLYAKTLFLYWQSSHWHLIQYCFTNNLSIYLLTFHFSKVTLTKSYLLQNFWNKYMHPLNHIPCKALTAYSSEHILTSRMQWVSKWFSSFLTAIKDTRAYKSNITKSERKVTSRTAM